MICDAFERRSLFDDLGESLLMSGEEGCLVVVEVRDSNLAGGTLFAAVEGDEGDGLGEEAGEEVLAGNETVNDRDVSNDPERRSSDSASSDMSWAREHARGGDVVTVVWG